MGKDRPPDPSVINLPDEYVIEFEGGSTPESYERGAEEVRELTGDKAAGGLLAHAADLRQWYEYLEKHGLEPLPFREAAKVYADAREKAWDEAPRSLVELGHRLTYSDEVLNLDKEEQDKLAAEYFMGARRVAQRGREILEEAGYVVYPWSLEIATKWGVAPTEEGAVAAFDTRPPPFDSKPHENKPADLAELNFLRVLSPKPFQTIDRASRGPAGWHFPQNEAPRFDDPRNEHFVEYFRDGATAEAMQEAVMRLNPRTADVWRLLTAESLEAWEDGQHEPPAVWLDIRDIAPILGYAKHVKGGYKRRDLQEIAQAFVDLDSFHITIPLGAAILTQEDPITGKRKRGRAEAIRRYKVLFTAAKDEIRDLFGNNYPYRWQLKPGEYIKNYPKAFAPLFRALVELPAKAGKYTWAKSIGTEVSYQYRQDRDRSAKKTLKVSTILERACLLNEVTENRNKGRMRSYFEEALDIVRDVGVCTGWEYEPTDIDKVDAKSRGWFDLWLEARVHITAPEELVGRLPKLKNG